MQRGNTKHGAARDDQLAHELEDTLRGNRAEDTRDPELPAEDDPRLRGRPERGEQQGEQRETPS
ncbi:hypothetical protein IU501_27855 [Nocardia otitidiscaviarum]|uniref:Uncharacterized protein n=1 Tax=Nocardia otitidiscaviarum TaxID=1823 RepID=A0A379JL56_9NOCA|nr:MULTISPECIES: hypothetical protein [Nocardia]MBF6136798.1 hypothetical protein [Nocardia otitidiscaviarum]MBF6239340.1 hypothetical protein [Nocardia otitidiscaviarum]MBF6485001.1 hypothetical protein [Nocardia otitidiscaviarum]SUD49094.1 Uncharacterised protein [Nocardia otitidiscaviarum]